MRALIRTIAAAAALVTVLLLAATGGQAAGSGHVYWGNESSGTIGRANLDGTGADQSFITGALCPAALAVDSNYVYWTNDVAGTIGRANLDGGSPDRASSPPRPPPPAWRSTPTTSTGATRAETQSAGRI